MRKTLCVLLLALALGRTVNAGVIHIPPAPEPPTLAGEIHIPPAMQPPPSEEQATEGQMDTPPLVQIALNLLGSVIAPF